MTATELLTTLVRTAFFLIAVVTVVDFLRFRGRFRLDIALMFSALAGSILAGEIQKLLGLESRWISTLGALAVVTQPYMLLRLVQFFQRVPRLVSGVAGAGLALSWVFLVAFPSPLPTAPTLVIVSYFAIVEGYAAVAFVRGSLSARGVRRWRLTFAAAGSGWLALAILLAGVIIVWPAAKAVGTLLTQAIALLSALSYYLGFAPPRPLRRAWQLAELYRFLHESSGQPASERVAGTLEHLCPAATRAVGGSVSAVWLWDESKQQLALRASDRPDLPPTTTPAGDGLLGAVWQAGQPRVERSHAKLGADLAPVAEAFGTSDVYAVPMATPDRRWGVLVVFLGHSSLFAEDDVDLLGLFAEQASSALEGAELLRKQGRLVERLEAANQELEAFSYSVSHDLRAPLRAMDGFSRILLESYSGPLPAEAIHYLSRIRDNAQRMGQLVDDLLTFSRLGRQPLKLQPVKPQEVARQAWEELRGERGGRLVEIHLGELPEGYADPALLKQVFTNLLDNALKYTRPRERASIAVGGQSQDHEPIYFVKDNGVGFDMAYAHKLFGVFQRLHRAEEYEGTGVGLAIVQRIIHRHGGRVWSEAAPDQGATFYFTLKGAAQDGPRTG